MPGHEQTTRRRVRALRAAGLDAVLVAAGLSFGLFTDVAVLFATIAYVAGVGLSVGGVLVVASLRAPAAAPVDAGLPMLVQGRALVGRAAARRMAGALLLGTLVMTGIPAWWLTGALAGQGSMTLGDVGVLALVGRTADGVVDLDAFGRPPGWYEDPQQQADWRWFDGRVWTGHTA